MAERFDVPERRCPKGHVITGKQQVFAKDRSGNMIYEWTANTSHLICEACAWEAGGGEIYDGSRRRMKRGKKLEKLGQESFLEKVPAKFIP